MAQSTILVQLPLFPEKACCKCGRLLPLDAFIKRRRVPSGVGGCCKDCWRAYSRAWRAQNRDRVQAYQAKWRAAHKEHHQALIDAWRRAHPERVARNAKKWRQANPEKEAERHRRRRILHADQFKRWQDQRRDSGRRRLANLTRRARLAAALVPGAPVTRAGIEGRFSVHGWRCYYCGRPLDRKTAVAEHRIPLGRGGLHCLANIVPSCRGCNFTKGGRTEREYRDLIAWLGHRPRVPLRPALAVR